MLPLLGFLATFFQDLSIYFTITLIRLRPSLILFANCYFPVLTYGPSLPKFPNLIFQLILLTTYYLMPLNPSLRLKAIFLGRCSPILFNYNFVRVQKYLLTTLQSFSGNHQKFSLTSHYRPSKINFQPLFHILNASLLSILIRNFLLASNFIVKEILQCYYYQDCAKHYTKVMMVILCSYYRYQILIVFILVTKSSGWVT